MFNPSQADVRRFFCNSYAKARIGQAQDAIEVIASQWMDEHPEFAGDFADLDAALRCVASTEEGRGNPFLHLSMHLSITEQCSIDQPRGIRQAVELLTHRHNSLHQAHHEARWSVWVECCRTARAPAAPPMARPMSPASSVTRHGTSSEHGDRAMRSVILFLLLL